MLKNVEAHIRNAINRIGKNNFFADAQGLFRKIHCPTNGSNLTKTSSPNPGLDNRDEEIRLESQSIHSWTACSTSISLGALRNARETTFFAHPRSSSQIDDFLCKSGVSNFLENNDSRRFDPCG